MLGTEITRHNQFLSTPSARRATANNAMSGDGSLISIHALREEGDGQVGEDKNRKEYFYPRPPRGGRPVPSAFCHVLSRFLSTPSARRATIAFSGDDVARDDFYPRPPRGGRQRIRRATGPQSGFLSTPSARRATAMVAKSSCWTLDFYPRPPRGGRLGAVFVGSGSTYFYPRPPRGGRPMMPRRHAPPDHFYPRPPRGGRHMRSSL